MGAGGVAGAGGGSGGGFSAGAGKWRERRKTVRVVGRSLRKEVGWDKG
ncbi:MAG: hypothetical protein NTX04_09140 [Verrucomicrobia bacterium]|nr:hypothetical protein [Verrucomicrobiota bacterium]